MTNPTVSDSSPSIQVSDSHDFQRALDRTVATMANPAYGNRLRLAKDLVQRGAVTLHDDGTATVISGDHTYDIAGACTCDDSRTRSPYCKHVLAAQLLSRMTQYLRSGQNGSRILEDSSATSAPPRSQAWAVREAPASCCLKFKIDGIEIMYTMRDVDDNALFPRVKRVLARLQDKIEPTGSDGPGQDTSDATAERPPGWCTKHDVQMRRFSSETGCWWSHPLDDGTWCKGK